MVPAAGTPTPSYGLGWGRGPQNTPMVLVPMGGGERYLSSPIGPAYICVPYVLPHSSGVYGMINASAPSSGLILLPGNLSGYYCTPSTSWRLPATEQSVFPAAGGFGHADSLPIPSADLSSPGPYSIPAQPAGPPPVPAGSSSNENSGTSAGPAPGRSLPAAESSPGRPAGPLVPIPEQPSPSQENPPPLNPPNPSLGPAVGTPVQPSFTPLPRRNPLLDRPKTPDPAKPDPRDRST